MAILMNKKTPFYFFFIILFFGMNSFALNCPKIHLGGLLNSKNSNVRTQTRRLTFATLEGSMAGSGYRTWNTYVPYDLDDAKLILKKISGEASADVIVCKYGHEKDPGIKVTEFSVSTIGPLTLELTDLDNKFVGVFIKNTSTAKKFEYSIRLKRPGQGRYKANPERNDLPAQKGFADTHNHQANELAFGGAYNPSIIHGSHKDELLQCTGLHTTLGDFGKGLSNVALPFLAALFGPAIPFVPPSTSMMASFSMNAKIQTDDDFIEYSPAHVNYPVHNAREPGIWWPQAAEGGHVQTHISYLKTAYENGMRLMVATALSNQALCIITSKNTNRNLSCDDMDSVKWQLKAFRDFEEQNSDWYKIVTDPWQARQAISENKMAIVLGIEASHLFPESHGPWMEQFKEVYDMGVRTIEFAHETDSVFAGSAHHHGMVMKLLNIFKRAAGFNDNIFKKTRKTEFCAPEYQNQGIECNSKGFTPLGKEMVDEFIKRKMILNIDHISRKARKELFEIVSEKHNYYPIYASHTRPDSMMHPEDRKGGHGTHEYMVTDEELKWIRQTGGMIGLRAGENPMLEIPECINKDLTCWGSSESFAQMLCHAADLGMPVAFGTDFSAVPMTAPRFSHNDKRTWRSDRLPAACPKNVELGFTTPFGYLDEYSNKEPQVLTGSTQSYGVRGLAHTGHLSGLLADLRTLGAPVEETKLADSAETFIRMWIRNYDRRGALSDRQYTRYMGATKKRYDEPLPPPDYDHHLKGLYKTCMKDKESGSKSCDSIADWNSLVVKSKSDQQKCPDLKQHVAYKDDTLFCRYTTPRTISSEDCQKTTMQNLKGSIDSLDGWCSWSFLHTSKPHMHVRRLKENTCPSLYKLIPPNVHTEDNNISKPFCRKDVASPITDKDCRDFETDNAPELQGYCVKDADSFYHVRKIVGHDKKGNPICPVLGLNRIPFDPDDDTLYCRKNLIGISDEACSQKGGESGRVEGHCSLQEDTYVRIWKLKNHNKLGERICQTPYTKHNVESDPDNLYCKRGVKASQTECTNQDGSMTKLAGYCSWDKGDWTLIAGLWSHNSDGVEKCPNLLNHVDLDPSEDKRFCRSSTSISTDQCARENGVTTRVTGFCTKEESDHIRTWQLKGYDSNGNFTFTCPTGYYKESVKDSVLYCRTAIPSKISFDDCRSQSGNSSELTGYCAWPRDFYKYVRPLSDYGSAGPPSCPSGTVYENRNLPYKDRCKKTTVTSSSLKCNLLATDITKNWTGPHSMTGTDQCRSTKGKNPKGVKCSAGYKKTTTTGRDTCTKTSTSYMTPTCRSGTTYKSQANRDACMN